jgi:hypothetical protein
MVIIIKGLVQWSHGNQNARIQARGNKSLVPLYYV